MHIMFAPRKHLLQHMHRTATHRCWLNKPRQDALHSIRMMKMRMTPTRVLPNTKQTPNTIYRELLEYGICVLS